MTRFTINNSPVEFKLSPDTPLLWALRDAANLTGTKYGCGAGLCGACTVHVDGIATRSCQVTIGALEGTFVTTIEGLSDDRSHPIQQAWIAEQVPQCGFCQSGMIMAAAALIKAKPEPTPADIDAEITTLCRCGTYPRIRRAIIRAARGDLPTPLPGPDTAPGEAVRLAPSLRPRQPPTG
ncbi:(2Fe-2S)-binding protein [Polymorphobacter multimanifer]|uniref:(2Fe-2S)-binding protein n=1 Tax=Polymorphobacter multimanifer TaxID=1070431 RepID=UPI00166CFF68|nr:(2Fe-2S)-binding protein [Polymorphobacter multimanifer]GGI74901.1 (2Fe-2S)-binding protein [Polymorphobacter multimanifer]